MSSRVEGFSQEAASSNGYHVDQAGGISSALGLNINNMTRDEVMEVLGELNLHVSKGNFWKDAVGSPSGNAPGTQKRSARFTIVK